MKQFVCEIIIPPPRSVIDVYQYSNPKVIIDNAGTGNAFRKREMKNLETKIVLKDIQQIAGGT